MQLVQWFLIRASLAVHHADDSVGCVCMCKQVIACLWHDFTYQSKHPLELPQNVQYAITYVTEHMPCTSLLLSLPSLSLPSSLTPSPLPQVPLAFSGTLAFPLVTMYCEWW